MNSARSAAFLVVLLLSGPAAAAEPAIDGIWGQAKGDGADCKGYVMVLHGGRYSKALLDLGTTQGPRDSIAGTSTYTFDGGRLEIAPSLSLDRPEPRQVFRWDPVADVLVREQPTPALTFRRCPDRPLRVMER